MSSLLLSIGEFSRITHLSAKTLRYYHRVGLLEPARVDPVNGYREYTVDQLPLVQLIRRFRALDMPVATVRQVVTAQPRLRTQLIADHLTSLEAELERTRSAVASLRSMLEDERAAPPVELRSVPPQTVLAIGDTIDVDDLGQWWTRAFTELADVIADAGLRSAGAQGGTYDADLFLHGHGALTVFVPLTAEVEPDFVARRAHLTVLPAVDLAVAVHEGDDEEIDRTYAALGAWVNERGISGTGPVRENYLTGVPPAPDQPPLTEICWPVTEAGRAGEGLVARRRTRRSTGTPGQPATPPRSVAPLT